MDTEPSFAWSFVGMITPTDRRMAAATSGSASRLAKWVEPISSSPSATSTRLTGSFTPAFLNPCSAVRKAISGPFWFTAPRPTSIVPSSPRGTILPSSGGDDHSAGSKCFTSYMK